MFFFLKKQQQKLTAIYSKKQQALDADTKATQLVSFTENLVQDGKTTMFFILEEVKEIVSDFHKKL